MDHKLDAPSPVPHFEMAPEALLLLTDPGAKLFVSTRQLQQLFDLTAAEANVAQALAQGTSLQGYAAVEGITEGTARIQLKSVFAKTNTHKQAELVALLARFAQPATLGH
jgi:DNA-binding CsgD family transcriptional regulator